MNSSVFLSFVWMNLGSIRLTVYHHTLQQATLFMWPYTEMVAQNRPNTSMGIFSSPRAEITDLDIVAMVVFSRLVYWDLEVHVDWCHIFMINICNLQRNWPARDRVAISKCCGTVYRWCRSLGALRQTVRICRNRQTVSIRCKTLTLETYSLL